MKKVISMIMALAIVVMAAGCSNGGSNAEETTTQAADVTTAAQVADETTTAVEEEKTTEATTEAEIVLADDSKVLKDFTAQAEANKGLVFDACAGYAQGIWVCGSDNKCMEEAISMEDLKNADHFEIAYTADEVPPTLSGDGAQLSFCFKFASTEELTDKGLPVTMEAWLPAGWYSYGPNEDSANGHSYHCEEVYGVPVMSKGVLIVPTSEILAAVEAAGQTDACLYIWQFGIACNAYDFDSDWTDEAENGDHYNVTISSVKLIAE